MLKGILLKHFSLCCCLSISLCGVRLLLVVLQIISAMKNKGYVCYVSVITGVTWFCPDPRILFLPKEFVLCSSSCEGKVKIESDNTSWGRLKRLNTTIWHPPVVRHNTRHAYPSRWTLFMLQGGEWRAGSTCASRCASLSGRFAHSNLAVSFSGCEYRMKERLYHLQPSETYGSLSFTGKPLIASCWHTHMLKCPGVKTRADTQIYPWPHARTHMHTCTHRHMITCWGVFML